MPQAAQGLQVPATRADPRGDEVIWGRITYLAELIPVAAALLVLAGIIFWGIKETVTGVWRSLRARNAEIRRNREERARWN
jgi:hypothetical protein